MSKIIKVTNLSYKINHPDNQNVWALSNINHEFSFGKITAIIGPSGSGKTMLCKHLNGLLKPTTGTVQIFDMTINSLQKKIPNVLKLRKTVGFVSQNPERQLFEENVHKEVIFGPLNFGFNKDVALTQAKKYFSSLGWNIKNLNQSPFKFSGGQKRKIALAGILAYEPEIIIFDSPTAGLDVFSQEKFQNLILDLKNNFQKTIIFVSHNMNEVLALADEVLLLDQGHKILHTTPSKLFQNRQICEKYQLKIPDTIRFIRMLNALGVDTTHLNWRSFHTFSETLAQQLGKTEDKNHDE